MLCQPCNTLESSTTTKDNTFWICQKKFSMGTEEPWQRERLGSTQPVYTGLLKTGLREANGDNGGEWTLGGGMRGWKLKELINFN